MLKADEIANASVERLRDEVPWLLAENARLRREAAQQVSWERERVMRDWIRRHRRAAPGVTEWVHPVNRLLVVDGNGDAFLGEVHVRDRAVPPVLVKPTTIRGRYQSGDVREAGPGSYIGKTLCGIPMMADELWCSARGVLQHAANHGRYCVCACVELCGACSYLSGRPTVEAAWEGP